MARKPTKSEKKHTTVPRTLAPSKSKVAEKLAKASTPVVVEIPRVEAPVAATAVVETAAPVAEIAAVITEPSEAAVIEPVSMASREIFESLRSGSADEARDAAIELGRSGNAEAVEALIEVVRNSDGYFHSVVRAAAAESLGRLGDLRAVDALISAVRDPMAEASAEAVRALAVMADARATEALLEVVRNNDGYYLPVVRRAAVLGLAKLRGAEATDELIRVAQNDFEDAVVRQAAIDACNG